MGTGMLSVRHLHVLGMVTSQLPLWSDKDAAQGWVVRESHRARRLTVRVFHTGRVEVVVPIANCAHHHRALCRTTSNMD